MTVLEFINSLMKESDWVDDNHEEIPASMNDTLVFVTDYMDDDEPGASVASVHRETGVIYVDLE